MPYQLNLRDKTIQQNRVDIDASRSKEFRLSICALLRKIITPKHEKLRKRSPDCGAAVAAIFVPETNSAIPVQKNEYWNIRMAVSVSVAD